jgi:hypothetical protein
MPYDKISAAPQKLTAFTLPNEAMGAESQGAQAPSLLPEDKFSGTPLTLLLPTKHARQREYRPECSLFSHPFKLQIIRSNSSMLHFTRQAKKSNNRPLHFTRQAKKSNNRPLHFTRQAKKSNNRPLRFAFEPLCSSFFVIGSGLRTKRSSESVLAWGAMELRSTSQVKQKPTAAL